MSSSQPGALPATHQEALRQLSGAAMQAAGEVLADLLLHEVSVGMPELRRQSWDAICRALPEPVVVVQVRYISGVEGTNLLVMLPTAAHRIADIMIGEPSGETAAAGEGPALDELHLSALAEAMNQMMGAAATALSGLFERRIEISPPRTEVARLDAANPWTSGEGADDGASPAVVLHFPLRIDGGEGEAINSAVLQIYSESFAMHLADEFLKGRTATRAAGVPSAAGASPGGSAPGSPALAPPAPAAPVPAMAAAAAMATAPTPAAMDPETPPDRIPMQLLKRVTVPVIVRLGQARLSLQDVLSLTRGSIVPLDAADGQPVDVLVSGTLVARGEVVVVREHFGVRITELVQPEVQPSES